ncbi:MAG: alpha/beta hydrolase [Myxococcota bacterium]|nr:alpha/beta hydrolase [Myxococcota bacterium]MEE2779354.1 alpha/beta hydrolase [Myxococcota bacterium]
MKSRVCEALAGLLLALVLSMGGCGSPADGSTSELDIQPSPESLTEIQQEDKDTPVVLDVSDDLGPETTGPETTGVTPVYAEPIYAVKQTEDLVYAQGLTHSAWGAEGGVPMDLLLDVYQPKDAPDTGKPALVVIHGGGFKQGNHKAPVLQQFCTHFASRGWVAISLTYRVLGHYGTLPDGWPVELGPVVTEDQARAIYPAGRDAKAAVRWLRAHGDQLGIHPDFVAAAGGSAGAFLSLLLGVSDEGDYTTELTEQEDPTLTDTHLNESSAVQVVIDLWGGTAMLDALQLFDGDSRFDAGDAPVAILHGTEDTSVPFTEAETIRQHYQETGAPYLWLPLEGEGHSAWSATIEDRTLQEIAHEFAAEQLGIQVIP